jgi:hypothetical protein
MTQLTATESAANRTPFLATPRLPRLHIGRTAEAMVAAMGHALASVYVVTGPPHTPGSSGMTDPSGRNPNW